MRAKIISENRFGGQCIKFLIRGTQESYGSVEGYFNAKMLLLPKKCNYEPKTKRSNCNLPNEFYA